MTDKKLTDNEIIKALECCAKAKTNEDCKKLKCPFFDDAIDMCGVLNSEQILIANALDLITRQQVEIENLKVENQSLRGAANSLKMHYEEARAEIERLKQRNAVYEAANRCIVWQRDRRDREIEELHSQIAGLNIYKSKIKAEAYKEFSEKAKEFMHNKFKALDEYEFEYITERDIDNLLKETVGENNE